MKILKKLDILEEGVAGVLFVGGVAVSIYGVFTRYVLNSPQAWITEIFEFMLVWSIFLGFGMALKDNRHIQVELLFDKLSFKFKRVVGCISYLIGAGFALFLAYSSVELITLTKVQATKTIDVGLPMWMTLLVLPISMFLLGIYFLFKSYKAAKGDKKELTGELEVLAREMKELSEENKKKGVGA